jgi:hypothetical protein
VSDSPPTRSFRWNNKQHEFECGAGDYEDARRLRVAIVSQAIKDFVFYFHPKRRKGESARYNWETAKGLLFDNDYHIMFGDVKISAAQLIAEALGYDDLNPVMLEEARNNLIKQARTYWEGKLQNDRKRLTTDT